jgi:hypothetical protein
MDDYIEVAESFAQALVARDFDRAYALLSPELRASLSPQALQESLRSMYAGYAPDDSLVSANLEREFCSDNWPQKEPGDLGFAYVGILGSEFVEAVRVVVSESIEGAQIRQVDWGRP